MEEILPTIDQELLDVALEALAKNKDRVDKLSNLADQLSKDMVDYKTLYDTDKKALDTRLNKFTDAFKKELEDTLKAIPVPKNGVDGKNGTNGKDGKDGVDGKQGKVGPKGEGPAGKQGIQGSTGPAGKDGVDGKSGSKGIQGKPGVGIDKITSNHTKVLIHLTDGRVVDIALPKAKEIPAGVTAMPTEIVVLRNLADTADIDKAVDGQTLTYSNGKWRPGSGAGAYTNPTPVPSTLGGVLSGTVFDNMAITEVLDMLLYPYLTPSFTSFSGISSPYEIGNTLNAGIVTFNWNTSNKSNIVVDSITISDTTNGTVLASGLSNDGNEALPIEAVTYTTPTQHTYTIKATNTKGDTFSRVLRINWYSAIYYGESTESSLDEAGVEGLRVKNLATNSSNIYDMLEGGYKWLCYPTSMGLKTSFTDVNTNFAVAMNSAEVVSVTNIFGITQDYYCHRTYNILGGSITIAMS